MHVASGSPDTHAMCKPVARSALHQLQADGQQGQETGARYAAPQVSRRKPFRRRRSPWRPPRAAAPFALQPLHPQPESLRPPPRGRLGKALPGCARRAIVPEAAHWRFGKSARWPERLPARHPGDHAIGPPSVGCRHQFQRVGPQRLAQHGLAAARAQLSWAAVVLHAGSARKEADGNRRKDALAAVCASLQQVVFADAARRPCLSAIATPRRVQGVSACGPRLDVADACDSATRA